MQSALDTHLCPLRLILGRCSVDQGSCAGHLPWFPRQWDGHWRARPYTHAWASLAFLQPTREATANDSKFLHVNSSSARTPRPSRPPSPASSDRAMQAVNGSDSRRHRSLSASGSSKDEFSEMSERMKHTRDFKNKGSKGNGRGHFTQAPFTTLEEMFKKAPEHMYWIQYRDEWVISLQRSPNGN